MSERFKAGAHAGGSAGRFSTFEPDRTRDHHRALSDTRSNRAVAALGVVFLVAIAYVWWEDYEHPSSAADDADDASDSSNSAAAAGLHAQRSTRRRGGAEKHAGGLHAARGALASLARDVGGLQGEVRRVVRERDVLRALLKEHGIPLPQDGLVGGGDEGEEEEGGGGGRQEREEGAKEKGKDVAEDAGESGSSSGAGVAVGGSGSSGAKYAYVTVVSVESYIEGALVLGESLKKESEMVKQGEVDLVLVASTPGITDDSMTRMEKAGWTVVQVDGLSRRVPKSHWADSFDKLYMFGLTQYQKAVFMDSDMMALASPDDLFTSVVLEGPNWVGAIGSSHTAHKKGYFQSGMMVFHPAKKVYSELMKDFMDGSMPGHGKSKYNTMNSRDGAMLRQYFGDRYVPVSKMYSKHLAPWESTKGVKMVHFRGSFKPWYNPHDMLEKKPEELAFGPHYRLWWTFYDALHRRETQHVTGAWGPKGRTHPQTHYWLLRHRDEAYTRRTVAAALAHRNKTREGTSLVRGKKGQSCTEACASAELLCDEEALSFLQASDCTVLKRAFRCTACDWAEKRDGFAAAEAPCYVGPAGEKDEGKCLRNYLVDPRMPAACAHSHASAERLCSCATKETLDNAAVPVSEKTRDISIL